MANKAKLWGVLCTFLVGALMLGCAGERPVVSSGDCRYFDNGGGLVLLSASNLREGEVVNVGLYDPKVPEARKMVERAEMNAETKAALELAGDQRHALMRMPGDPLHGNFFVWRRWANRIFGIIPDFRQARVWFGIGPVDGTATIDNDPDDGIVALGYDFIDTEKGPDRAKHLGHAPGFGPEPKPARCFRKQPAQQAVK